MSKFKVGDFVEVINWGQHYSSDDWTAKKMGLKKWVNNSVGFYEDKKFNNGGKFGSVVAIWKDQVGVLIGKEEYIIGETGLEKSKRKVKVETTRKDKPVFSGVLKYFPDALLEISIVSKAGNDQHNAGQPLHWDKSKSTDEEDALTRHLIDLAKGIKFDTDGIRHSAKIAWRALANLQRELENDTKEI